MAPAAPVTPEETLRAAGWVPHHIYAAAWVRPDGTWFPTMDSAYRHVQIDVAFKAGGEAAVKALYVSWNRHGPR